MREEYEIEKLNPRKNIYAKQIKKQITINLDQEIVDYFKDQANIIGIPYQTLINTYLSQCVAEKKQLNLIWK